MLLFPKYKMADEGTCFMTSHALSEISVLYYDLCTGQAFLKASTLPHQYLGNNTKYTIKSLQI